MSDSFAIPQTGDSQAPPVCGISQTRILEWVAIYFSRVSSQPRDRTHISCIGRQFLYHWAISEALYIYHFLFCSFSDKSAHTLKLQSMRGKERRKEDEFSPFQWLSWQHQPLPKEICPASVLIKHIYNSVLYICNLTIELVAFNWQQMVFDYCLPRRKRKNKACQYLLNMD